MMSNGRNMIPFTASQWQELEDQALIFQYMVTGMPIPPDFLHTIKTSLDSSLSSMLLLHQPQHVGSRCIQRGYWDGQKKKMGFWRKLDPDPGRCRRTDGKKWRCSKEAYSNSKYCEKHMHRGRNRSRKPVEVLTTQTPTPTSSSAAAAAAAAKATQAEISISSTTKDSDPSSLDSIQWPSRDIRPMPLRLGISSQENHNFLHESSHCSHAEKDYSYGHEMKEVGEHSFLCESSMDDSWQLTLGAPLGHLNQKAGSDLQTGQAHLGQYQHYYGPSSDDDQPPKKVMHHFFDEWSPKDKDSWLDYDLSLSKTQLSISMPNTSSYDFFKSQNDK